MKTVSVEEFKHALKEHGDDTAYDFVNVCEPEEYRAAHISGTRNVPLSSLLEHIDEFKSKAHIYVQCRSGNRSQMAAQALEQNGITGELINVDGGLIAWDAAGHDTESLA
jgi:rhodanese-related sulfurtransferase